MLQQLNQNKANKVHLGYGFSIFFVYKHPTSMNPSRIFLRTWYSIKRVPPDFVHSLWSTAISVWKECSIIFWERPSRHTGLHRKHGAFYWQIPTPFHSVSFIYAVICSSDHGILWRELVLSIWNMSLQENASSLWKRCNIPSNIKPSFRISRWGFFCVYSGPFIKGTFIKRVFGISWRMCKTASLFFK